MVAAAVFALLAAGAARADDGSLYRGPAPRPGPDLLYAPPAEAPQLTNAGPWRAAPILVSGAAAYRDGEYLYQDFLYDDHGADSGGRDPSDPRANDETFAQPGGSYTYPTAPSYAGNAADLVELRVRPMAGATAFRVTLNTLIDAERTGFTIAIGDSPVPRAIPHGANATAPAELFLTVHGHAADLRDAATGALAPGGAPAVAVDRERRQVEVRVPHGAWNPGRSTVRLAAAAGLWDAAGDRYLIPARSRTTETPGGAGPLPAPTAFFNVAFRFAEPLPEITDPAATAAGPAWWRDRAQGEALRTGDLSPFHADVDFGKLADRVADDSAVPRTGPLARILASRFEPAQGVDHARACGGSGGCLGAYGGRLQPYAVYVPAKAPAGGRYGLTALLHARASNYSEYAGSRHESQLGERGQGHIVFTPQGRDAEGWYYELAGADAFEVWADVARHYPLDPDLTSIAGYSMGGYGTFKLATQFPDLFARAHTTVGPPGVGIWTPPSPPQPGGERSLTFRQLASARHVPFLMWAAAGDQLVPYPGPLQQAQGFDALGLRYELDTFSPAEHLTLAVNDQYEPAARFLGDARVARDPARITYVRNPTMDFPAAGTTADHAYWLSAITLRDGGGAAPLGTLDVRSAALGAGEPPALPTERGGGTLTGGSLGAIGYTSQRRDWGPAAPEAAEDALTVTARNVSALTVHPERARLSCSARVRIDTDGPIAVTLAGCSRTITVRGPAQPSMAACTSRAAGFRRVSAGRRGKGLRIAFAREARRRVAVDVFQRSSGRHVLGNRRVARFRDRTRSFTWRARGATDGYYVVRFRMPVGDRTDVRRIVVQREDGRFRPRPAAERRPSCGILTRLRLGAPVFGGTRRRSLTISFGLREPTRVRVEVRRKGRVVRRLGSDRLRRNPQQRLRLGATRLRPGTYRIRLRVTPPGGETERLSVTARRL